MNCDTPLTCIIVDDEPVARHGLRSYANRTETLSCVAMCDSSESLDSYLRMHPAPDIIFIDICMPGISGIDYLATHTVSSAVIIVTAYEEYALLGYDLNVTDYLLKPVSYIRFLRAVEKAQAYTLMRRGEPSAPDSIFIRTDRIIHRIITADIIYIKALENYVRILTESEHITARMTLKSILAMLPHDRFMMTHKSYIVNLDRILSVDALSIRLTTGKSPTTSAEIAVPLSRAIRAGLLQRLGNRITPPPR